MVSRQRETILTMLRSRESFGCKGFSLRVFRSFSIWSVSKFGRSIDGFLEGGGDVGIFISVRRPFMGHFGGVG